MIVSHAHRFIFVPIPKTGTHAVRQALREHMGPEDIEQVGLFVTRKFPWPGLAAIGHGHLGLRQVAPYLGPEAMRDYLKFAFVRNPFDRFVSYCAFMTRMRGDFDRDPRGTMRRILFEVRPLDRVHFQPQHTLLVEEVLRTRSPRIDRRVRLAAMLHDAPEYVIGDMISPFKAVIGGSYKAVEKRLLAAIHLHFGLPAVLPADIEALIKTADMGAAYLEATSLAGFSQAEAKRLFGRDPKLNPATVENYLTPWSATKAERQFLARCQSLIA